MSMDIASAFVHIMHFKYLTLAIRKIYRMNSYLIRFDDVVVDVDVVVVQLNRT